MSNSTLRLGFRLFFGLTLLAIVMFLVPFFIKVFNAPYEDDMLVHPKYLAVLYSLLLCIGFFIPILLCEYGMYSSLRYLLTEDKSKKGRFVWKMIVLVICLIVFVWRVTAFVFLLKFYSVMVLS